MSNSVLSSAPLAEWRGSVTIFKGFTGTRPEYELKDVTWSDVRHLLCPDTPAVISDKKQGQYLVPCLLKEAPLVANTLEAATKNGQPTMGKMRSKQHVTEAAMLIMDVDGLPETDFKAALDKIEGDGLTFLAYTTHSHGREDKPGIRARVAMPLDRPVGTEDYAAAWHGFDSLYWNGQAGQVDASGASLYQQQGTWCCDPSRVGQAAFWIGHGGVASADSLVAIGRVALASKAAQSNTTGRERPTHFSPIKAPSNTSNEGLSQLNALLDYIDPDCGYDDWLRVLMAIHHETGASAEGLELADVWSSLGDKYQGTLEVREKWESFRLDHPNPITIATLKQMVAANGYDWIGIVSAAEDPFLPIDNEEGNA